MALVIENGSIVPGANSYVTVSEFRTYAQSRGVTVPTDDDEVISILLSGMDFLESYEPKFKGKRVSSGQPLSWPRSEVCIYGETFPSDSIPSQIKLAQMQAGILVVNGFELMPNITGFAVRREKVDVIEVEYATGGGQNNTATEQMTPKFPIIASTLSPLIRTVGFLQAARA